MNLVKSVKNTDPCIIEKSVTACVASRTPTSNIPADLVFLQTLFFEDDRRGYHLARGVGGRDDSDILSAVRPHYSNQLLPILCDDLLGLESLQIQAYFIKERMAIVRKKIQDRREMCHFDRPS